MAYGQILGPQLDPEFDPEALRGLGAENRVLKVRTNSPFLYSFIVIYSSLPNKRYLPNKRHAGHFPPK